MSKLSEYSKFDHIQDDEDDSDQEPPSQSQQDQVQGNQPFSSQVSSPSAAMKGSSIGPNPVAHGDEENNPAMMRKDGTTGRYIFEYQGQKIYEWEQTLDDVTIYVLAPPFVTRGSQVNCKISTNRLQLGLQGGQQWFLNEDTYGTVDVSESTWSLEEEEEKSRSQRVITIYLTKAHRGELWEAALQGNKRAAVATLDPFAKEQVKKDLLLERFQEENPGMDFRGAEFNGSVPDARTFMDGVKYR